MNLIGECDVPSTKCGLVIQAVSKWIFEKDIPLTQLPSSNTCIEMADRAQVLSKYQVTERLTTTERWDLHTDGTSRDHKKIVGLQVNLDSGTTLSAGFSGVAVEDSSTLLDNAIAMLDELADVFAHGTDASESEK